MENYEATKHANKTCVCDNADCCSVPAKCKTHFAQIIVQGTAEHPYYGILYFNPSDKEYHVGYGSYHLANVFDWLTENFEIIPQDQSVPNYEEELKIRCDEIKEMKHNLSAVLDERSKIGIEYEQALKRIDTLNRKIEYYRGQVYAYQYCMNCRQ